ncbi:hypothetical protein QTJ16_003675 [Diplocarpon rosae]|uniref:PH domain-containing protein n=1 Tax=Diplocarpon rosae TaxID=946125 RepID=A0AAD9SZH5_9HELO|nr:hypothetical protein QTJ16_003675 [Diplocarpon rosae]
MSAARKRVLSFISNFNNRDSDRSPSPNITSETKQQAPRYESPRSRRNTTSTPQTQIGASRGQYNFDENSVQSRGPQRARAASSSSRPMSMIQTYHPSLMDVTRDTLPELQPIFTFLNSHANKLYQEGYFLKLDDQNTYGRPNADRTWTECFAQLVGTVLSLWDAAELDSAGQDGEVLPKFINLSDASIKMIEALPTRADNEPPLQNVLSISTAGKNRYLLHFSSHHSLIQWTAGIRLAMFEHATLQEAYTGALIAGKGKALNNINSIMDRARMPTADWARVRFGAGTPWRRCWCVITPPDEKEVQKIQKQLNKKKSAYDRSKPPVLKGEVRFYDTKKTKKIRPIATISDAYSAFAIYPQSKPLIDASTLVKVEGSITIHSNPPSTTEGFVFVMPEVHPAVTGFEMMLRWLFPVFDTFALYGRPERLVADTTDPRSLMFAMPKHRRYGYLEILDVSGLILEPGSANWKEGEWRKRMKELSGKRMTTLRSSTRTSSKHTGSRSSIRNSFGPSRTRIHFDDGASVRSTPSNTWGADQTDGTFGAPRTDPAPTGGDALVPPSRPQQSGRSRSVSDTQGFPQYEEPAAPSFDGAHEVAPATPPHEFGVSPSSGANQRYLADIGSTPERISSEDEQVARSTPVRELQELQASSTPEPVALPPPFSHPPGTLPIAKPYQSPDVRKANSRMSNATLVQMAGAAGYHPHGDDISTSEDQERQNVKAVDNGDRGVQPKDADLKEFHANEDGVIEGLVTSSKHQFPFEDDSPYHITKFDTHTNKLSPQNPSTSQTVPSGSQVYLRTGMPSFPTQEQPSSNRTYQPPQVHSIPRVPVGNGHSHQQSIDCMCRNVTQPPTLHTNPSIVRKPIPARDNNTQSPVAETPSSTGSLGQHLFDQAAFEMIGHGNQKSKHSSEDTTRHNTMSSSVYDDSESTMSPDYASTTPSVARPSIEKPRAGILKTVGNADVESGYTSPIDIDFGPTLNLASGRSPSPGPAQAYGGRAASPGPVLDLSPGSFSKGPDSSGKSLARKATTPENEHHRNRSLESRTVAWQPGIAAGGNAGKRHSITAEQFVQQRASMLPATPLYAHQRQPSSNTLRANTPTPPLVHRASDYMGHHSRNSSTDLLQRPSSLGANVVLGSSRTGDLTSSLSAREQEKIAKMTGTPLINMANNNNRQPTQSGLVAAIDAREREKQQMKQGLNSTAVQNAITQRQQQALYEQQLYQDQFAPQYRAPQQYHHMGQLPQQFQPLGQHQRQSWNSPAASVFAPGGGWRASTPAFVYAVPEQGRQSPLQPPTQQQYFPPKQRLQGRGNGNGNGGFHGHGY